ncbi:MAG TPA: DUF998 domain-containing protein [Candidatus Nanoarchaeia archaeon]|nr:DUF998 domain-containing protein [Candidatus Nanoarchaeia archaeon]
MNDNLRSIFSCISVISSLAFLGLITRLHFFPKKYNPVKNTVSDYAVMPSGKPYPFTAVSGAVSSLSLAIAIAAGVKAASISVILFLVISSLARFSLIFFPTDVTGQISTKKGKIHLALAMIAFAGIAFAAGNFQLTAVDQIIGQVVIFTAILLLLGFLPKLRKIFGLLERIFLLSSITWLVVLGLELFFKR